MEVTPIDPRGVSVSLGDGAKPHGRDTSPPKEEATSSARAPLEPKEWPIDLAAERLAATLHRAAPALEPKVVDKLVDHLLSIGKWETKPEPDADGGTSRLDAKA